MFLAQTSEEVPQGMKNYSEKYRKFGEAFRDLMRDRPTIMITDDHDVFANDLWGKGGLRMDGNRTTGEAPVVLLHGDVHLGTLGRHGVDDFNDGPVTYSLPSFSSKASRRWEPLEPGGNRKLGAPENTGEFHDRFGNKITMYGAGNGLNGYGLILFDTKNRTIELQFHPMNEERKPIKIKVPGWPYKVAF